MNEEKEILSYTLVLHSAREKLGITLNEYAVADLIYHLANNPKNDFHGWCYASKEALGDFVGIDRATVFRIIDRLIEKGIIIRNPETKYLQASELWYNTVVLPKIRRNAIDSRKMRLPPSQNASLDSRKTPPNNNRYKYNYNNYEPVKEKPPKDNLKFLHDRYPDVAARGAKKV
jgi:MarR family